MWWQQRFGEFVTLFLVINPIGALPTFLEIAATLGPKEQRKLALNAVWISFVVLFFFVVTGAFLLERMGISIRAFQISGGILLFLVALDMIRGQTLTSTGAPRTEQGGVALAIFPLAIPMIAGPGAMLTVVMLTDDDQFNFPGQMSTVGIVAVVLLITFLLLLAAGPIARVIGTAGISIISRVMGLLLAALAVTIVLGAVGDWLNLRKL